MVGGLQSEAEESQSLCPIPIIIGTSVRQPVKNYLNHDCKHNNQQIAALHCVSFAKT